MVSLLRGVRWYLLHGLFLQNHKNLGEFWLGLEGCGYYERKKLGERNEKRENFRVFVNVERKRKNIVLF